jgi:hypothetical protein
MEGNAMSKAYSEVDELELVDNQVADQPEDSTPKVGVPSGSRVPAPEGASLGLGYDSFRCSTRGEPLQKDFEKITLEGNKGQRVDDFVRLVKSTTDLKEALNLGAEASFNGWGIDAKGSAKWVSENNMNSYCVYLLIRVKVTNPEIIFTPKKLTAKAKKEIGDGSPAELIAFTRGYGDMFISSVQSGGEFNVLYHFHTNSEERKQQITAKLQAAISKWSMKAEASGEFTKAMASISSTVDTRVESYRDGGRGDSPKGTPEDLLAYAVKFPTLVDSELGDSVAYTVGVQDYQAAAGFPLTIDLPFEENYRKFRILAPLRDRLMLVAGDIKYAEGLRMLFTFRKPPADVPAIEDIDEQLEALATKIKKDPTVSPSGFDATVATLTTYVEKWEKAKPVRAVIEYSDWYGPQMGEAFDDAREKKVSESRDLRSLHICHGHIFDGFEAFYRFPDGKIYSAGKHGNLSGMHHADINLQEDEYLTQIEGWLKDNFVRRIVIKTNKNTFGPYGGDQSGQYFSLKAPAGFKIFALRGYHSIPSENMFGIRTLGLVSTNL